MFDTSILPPINASLNGLAAILLLAGYVCIRLGLRSAHRAIMIAAFATSTVFLALYLTYHYTHLATVFPGHGTAAWAYYVILFTHVVLAVVVVPLALTVLYRAWKQDFVRHRRLARWTFPIWLYVSVTGVVVYWMLYQVQWS